MHKLYVSLIAVLFAGLFADRAFAQAAGFGLEPAGVEVELYPGQATTTAFLITAPNSLLLRDRLLLSLADWETDKQGIVLYKEPGTLKRSAASWIHVHPISVTMFRQQVETIRITVRVPVGVEPGLYTTAVLVEEKPVAATTKLDGTLTPKFFYPFTIYVTVRPPAPAHGVELSMFPR